MALLGIFARCWRSLRWNGRGRFRLGAMALLGAAWFSGPAQAAVSREYEIKAIFLYNFAQFVDWPPGAFQDEHAPVVIGVLGEDPFGTSLDQAVRGETVNGRPLVVRRFSRIEDVATCHMLFVSRSETARLDRIMSALRGRNVLTVGDTEEFSLRAGMIRFVMENNKVRLRINVDAARAADLAISSKLLRPAEIVSTRKE